MKFLLPRFLIVFVAFALPANAQMSTLLPLTPAKQNTTVVDPYSPDSNTPTAYAGLSYVWGDEFNYTGAPDPAMWSYEQGFTRNQELQWYQEKNASVSNGRLLIEGRRETIKNPNYVAGSSNWKTNRQYAYYTSSSIITWMKRQFYQGRIEVRAKLDTRLGNWPAIWTLGQNKEWPHDGEIDMLEYYVLGGKPSILANFVWGSTTRWVGTWNSKATPLSYFTAKDADWVNKYHVWRMDWDATKINLYLDDELLNSQQISAAKNPDGSICFNQPQYLLLNLALGANGGDPSSTVFPTKYEVDYFRVYQKTVDLQKPSVVTNVVVSNVSNSSCTLSWTPSADNVGVVAYHIYKNGYDAGAYLASTNTNTINLTDLTPNGTNSIIIRALDEVGNYSDLSTPVNIKTVPCLSGTNLKDAGGVYGDNANNGPEKAFDNDVNTFYDAKTATGAWTGLDLANSYKITRIRYCTRADYTDSDRMNGGKFQGSNSADFSGAVTLCTVSGSVSAGAWRDAAVTNPGYYRYVRYVSPVNGFCNVAEIEFYGDKDATGLFNPNVQSAELQVLPLPATHFIELRSNERLLNVNIAVFNTSGQLVLSKMVDDLSNYKMDISGLSDGAYVLKITGGKKNLTARMVKTASK